MVSKTIEQTQNLHCPIGWAAQPFGDVCTMRTEKFDPVDGTDAPYVALEHLEQDTGRLSGVGHSSETTSIKASFKENDILFGKLRPYLRKYWYATFNGVCSTEIMPLVPRDSMDKRFTFYVIQQDKFINHSIRHSFGTKMPRTSWKEVSDFVCLVPPLAEQRKIAAILTSVDDAIVATQRIIDQTEVVKRGLMQKLLTKGIGHTTFKQTEIGEIPTAWSLLKIDELGSEDEPVLRTGPFGSSLKTEHFTDSGVPVVNIFNLAEGYLDTNSLFYVAHSKAEELANYRLKHNHIVFSRVADIGRSAVIPKASDGWVMSSNLMRIAVNPQVVQPHFFYYTLVHSPLVTKQVQRGVNNAGRDTITSNTLKSLLFPIPSLEEQSRITSSLQAVDDKQRAEEAYLTSLNSAKNALMQVLLTGKVRVNVEEPSEVSV